MDMEQLKIVLEMVKAITGDASMVVIVYMVAQFLLTPVKMFIGIFGLYKIVQLIVPTTKEAIKDIKEAS